MTLFFLKEKQKLRMFALKQTKAKELMNTNEVNWIKERVSKYSRK